ncbi:hypothetical protein HN51_021824 [Arachis hypogaea]|uniref:RRM domain-containing protein n=2 Tax=Arachis hypogaea TaxID=3818 RepID=A0A445EGP7_ARAHY|nr:hypothetical protein Ahy_A02g009333 [Arachis hypogaea]
MTTRIAPGVGANLLGQHSAERNQDATAYATQDKKSLDVGANLFIGNLDPDVDEKLLYDTFSAFGVIVTNPKFSVKRVGQYLCNRQITVSYAYKKDTKGERQGMPAERVLAASNPTAQKSRPHTRFASAPPTLANVAQANGTIAVPVPPHPFANGVAPLPIPALRPPPPPPQAAAFQPMAGAGQPPWHQQQPGLPPGMPPPQVQQFRPPPSGMPMPPPPQAVSAPPRPLPPPAGMVGQPPVWRPQPPPPQQQSGRPMAYPQPSMPPPPSYSQMPPPQ